MAAGLYIRTTLILLLVLLAPPVLFAAEPELPQTDSFAEIGHLSLQQGIPVVVFVSRDACPYCRTLRDQILKPMLAADKFEDRAILVEVSLDRIDPITGFDKEQMTAKDFGKLYKAELTPTLLFLDSEGREIGKRLIGISNLEFYGHYLQKSIDEALVAIRPGPPQV